MKNDIYWKSGYCLSIKENIVYMGLFQNTEILKLNIINLYYLNFLCFNNNEFN